MVSEVKTYRNKTNIEITECHEGNSKACTSSADLEGETWLEGSGRLRGGGTFELEFPCKEV